MNKINPYKNTLQSLRQELLDNNLQLKAVIQDILEIASHGSMSELEALNEVGRAKMSALRTKINELEDWAKDLSDRDLSEEVDAHREQFAKTVQAFRKSNLNTMKEIERLNREQLMEIHDKDDLRQRKISNTRHNQSSLVSMENDVTEKMLAVSRHLSETTQKSAATLESLVASSMNVDATKEELFNTAGTIKQSGKLLQKYGRRDTTDKILLFFGFAFFMACCFYIIHKRIF